MYAYDLEYTEKWQDVLADDSQVLFLEGPSQTSKTTLSGVKLVYECMKAPKGQTYFMLAGESTPTLYRNFVEPETGVTRLFPNVRHVGGGSEGGQRIEVDVSYEGVVETKKIFFVGYQNKNSAQKVLGSKPYMIFADEFNIAHENFVRAVFTRIASVGTKLIATSNGDDPDKLFYQYLNACRPLKKYELDVPTTTMQQMDEVPENAGWTYYFFGLDDRPLATSEWIERMMNMHPKGSFEFNSKVLGIRAATEGVLYADLLTKRHDIDFEKLNIGAIKEVIIGIDVGGGGEKGHEERGKTIFIVSGYSRKWQRMVVLDSKRSTQIGHRETTMEFQAFIDKWWKVFYHRIKGIYIDSAEPALIYAMEKHMKFPIDVRSSIKSNKIVDAHTRVTMKEQMLHHQRMLFTKSDGSQAVKQMLAKVKGVNGVMLDEDETWNDYSDALDYSMTPRYRELMNWK